MTFIGIKTILKTLITPNPQPKSKILDRFYGVKFLID